MSGGKKFEEAILAIHETLNKAERQLARLGEDLQFLIGDVGDVEIVRRTEKGEPVRPKIVIAELTGTDPMFWRPDHPRWLRKLEPQLDADPLVPKGGNGQPSATGEGEEGKNGGSEPPASTGGQS